MNGCHPTIIELYQNLSITGRSRIPLRGEEEAVILQAASRWETIPDRWLFLRAEIQGTTLSHAICLRPVLERVVWCKSNLQLAYDCRVRHEECRGLLKRVLKPYDNRSNRQFYIVKIVCDFTTTRAARTIKIACDNRKQKSYRANRP